MRPVCHLHIGMNKAGSTTIQAALDGFDNGTTEYLQRQGTPTATLPLVLGYRDRPPVLLREVDVDLAVSRRNSRIEFEGLMASSDKSAIVSSEYLSHFPSVENASDVLDTICASAEQVQILSYLRPPRAFLRSVLQQVLKRNAPPDTLDTLWPAYQPRNERWCKAVTGRGEMTCVAFRPDQFKGGDLLQDFCDRVEIDPNSLNDVPPQNEGLTLEACAVLAQWHKARADNGAAPSGHATFERLVAALQTFGTTQSWGFSKAAMEAVTATRQKDLAWAAKRTGCPDFAEEADPDTELDGVADLFSLASGQAAALQTWAETVAPGAKPTGPDVVSLMTAVHTHLNTPPVPKRSFTRRLAGTALRRLRPTR